MRGRHRHSGRKRTLQDLSVQGQVVNVQLPLSRWLVTAVRALPIGSRVKKYSRCCMLYASRVSPTVRLLYARDISVRASPTG